MPLLTNTIRSLFYFFQLRNIGKKNRRFVFGKFVKTGRELNNSARITHFWTLEKNSSDFDSMVGH